MLTKSPKPAYKKFITFSLKAVILIEAAGLAVSYGLWHKLNSDRGKQTPFHPSLIKIYLCLEQST